MAVLIRAVFMILVLVGLPAAWVYYGPLPPSAQRVADRVLELAQDALGWNRQEQSAETMIAAPRYKTGVATEVSLSPTFGVASESESLGSTEIISAQVEPLLKQLRSQGVAEYTLEKWGDAGHLYRFRCAMPWVQSEEITRQFEAIADNPLASIEQVVREVSSWQTTRQGQHQLQ